MDQTRPFTLNPKQGAFVFSDKKFRAFIGGRGSGKTFTGCLAALMRVQTCPGSLGVLVSPCYDEKTEILTENGWKPFSDINVTDKVATLQDEERLVFETPKRIIVTKHDGEMIGISSQEIDLLVTPNHRIYSQFKDRPFEMREAHDIYGHYDRGFKKTATWNGLKSKLPLEWFEFLGFWFAEGYAQSHNGRNRITITQKKEKEYIRDLLAKLQNDGLLPKHHEYYRRGSEIVNFEMNNKELASEFVKYGKAYTKTIPRELFSLDADCARAFLRGFIKGDGHEKCGKHDQTQMWTKSRQLADDIQELTLRAGLVANVALHNRGMYYVCIRTDKKLTPKIEKHHWYKEHYRGNVYCVTTTSGIILVRRGGKACWCGNSYPMLRDSTTRMFFDLAPPNEIIKYNETKKEVKFKNGSEVLFRSADDPDSLRGPNIAWFIIDEGAMVGKEAWDVLIATLRQRGHPHFGAVLTTPKGFNWVYKRFVEANDPDTMVVYSSSSENASNLPQGFIDELKRQYSGIFFKQEVLGEFVGFEGLVYPEFSDAVHVISDMPSEFSRVIAGVDFGYVNPSVIIVVGLDGDGRAYILDEVYRSGLTQDVLTSEAKRLKDRYKITQFFCDPSEPALIATMNQNGLASSAAKNEVIPGIMEVSSRLKVQDDGRPRLFLHKGLVNTLTEFHQYRYAEVKKDILKEEPLKVYDHAMDALRYVLYSLKKVEMKLAGKFGKYEFW